MNFRRDSQKFFLNLYLSLNKLKDQIVYLL